MIIEAMGAGCMRMFRQTKTDLVGNDDAVPSFEKRWKDLSPQPSPGGITVKKHDGWCIFWTFIDVVHPPAVNAREFRFVGVAARDVLAEVLYGAIDSVFLIGYWHASGPVVLGEVISI